MLIERGYAAIREVVVSGEPVRSGVFARAGRAVLGGRQQALAREILLLR
jgi:hypothetical protein